MANSPLGISRRAGKSTSGIPPSHSQTPPSLPQCEQPRPHARLKTRLKEFWNSQELYWSLMTEEKARDSENRARAASMIPEGSRVLDVACGRATNYVWLADRVQYFGCDISQKGLSSAQRP